MSELRTILATARRAAELINEVYARPFDVDYKAPRDPVTEADRAANQLICRELAEQFADVPIVAEESSPESYAGFEKAERVFFVDPLDGTREFVARNGEFVVMIGLVEDQRPKLGVLLAPVSGIAWVADVGTGAWRVSPDDKWQEISVRSVSNMADAKVLVSRSHLSATVREGLARMGAGELLPRGSAGLKAAAIAEGSGDIYVAPGRAGKRWDVCGPEAVVRGAGGAFTDTFGKQFDYRSTDLTNRDGIIATGAPHLHALVREHLEREKARLSR